MANLSAQQRYQLAGRLFQTKRYPEALQLLDVLVTEVPGNTEIMHARAMCLAMAGRREEALQAADLLANIYGDPRGAQLRAQLTAPQAAAPGKAAPGSGKRAAKQAAPRKQRSRKSAVAVLAIAAAAVALGGGAYYYLGAGAVTMPGKSAETPVFTSGFAGDPAGEKVAVSNETEGILELWLGDVSATSPPVARLDVGGEATVGVSPGAAKFRARASWLTQRYVSANTDIDISGPFRLVFTRATNAIGVDEVKWRKE